MTQKPTNWISKKTLQIFALCRHIFLPHHHFMTSLNSSFFRLLSQGQHLYNLHFCTVEHFSLWIQNKLKIVLELRRKFFASFSKAALQMFRDLRQFHRHIYAQNTTERYLEKDPPSIRGNLIFGGLLLSVVLSEKCIWDWHLQCKIALFSDALDFNLFCWFFSHTHAPRIDIIKGQLQH